MSLNIIHAHTGTTYATHPNSYSTLEELRSWISRKTSIQSAQQILMTAQGKQVKLQSLNTEQDIFLYDRSLLASPTTASRLLATLDTIPAINSLKPPVTSPRLDSLQDFQRSALQSKEWAIEIEAETRKTVGDIKKCGLEIDAIRRGANIAVSNIRQHMNSLQPKYEEIKAWADQIYKDQTFLLEHWQSCYDDLATVPVDKNFTVCLDSGNKALDCAKKRESSSNINLQDYAADLELYEADPVARNLAQRFKAKAQDLETSFSSVTADARAAVAHHQQIFSMADSDLADQSGRLLEEIEVLCKKLSSDYDYLLGLPEAQKSVSQAAKVAQTHKSNFIPSIIETRDEIGNIAEQISQQKHNVANASIAHLQQIAILESKISSVHSNLSKLDVDPDASDAFHTLNFVVGLPSTYGFCLIEYVRRCQWTDEMISSTALPQHGKFSRREQEIRVRNKWQKDMDGLMSFTKVGSVDIADTLDTGAFEAVINVQNVQKYIQTLKKVENFKEHAGAVKEAALVLTGLPKQSTKAAAKGFKNGSLHEASFSGPPVPGPIENQNMPNVLLEKAKVDEKLKSAESRIRKLEDLLHRQSQVSRPQSSGGFNPSPGPTFERHTTTPSTNFTSALSKARDLGSRRSSTSSRRVSQNLDAEERSLAQRIVSLEADLMAEKDQNRRLMKDATARLNAEENLKGQAREAIATKEDLLGNMEAQQHEFEGERRLLEEENGKLNVRLEELEDEFERILHHNEHDTRLSELQYEMDRLRVEADQVEEALRTDLKSHRDRINSLEKSVDQRELTNNGHEATIQQMQQLLFDQEDAESGRLDKIGTILQHFPGESVSSANFDDQLDHLQQVIDRTNAHKKDLEAAVKQLQADNGATEQQLKYQTDEIADLKEQLRAATNGKASVDEDLASKVQEYDLLQIQLGDIKSKFSSSEIERNILQERVAKMQSNHDDLHQRFVGLQGFHGELDDQLHEKNEELHERNVELTTLRQTHEEVSSLTDGQARRAEEISKRLQLQIESLKKLLELVGFMISKQDDSMIIQKVPRTSTSGSVTLTDQSTSMKRSISGPPPISADLLSTIESDALHWATASNPSDAATRYTTFLETVSSFDIDAFTSTIYKRIKDIEHLARKWQREAKLHRAQSHRFQTEAHERISLRSFKEGDLALFLPTRDQATKPWAAFNVGAPHYFLREQESHKLAKRDWLIARISKVEERVVDLGKSMHANGFTEAAQPDNNNDENPYALSDGLRWYLLDATEEKPGALPINVGTGKATVSLSKNDEEPIKASMGLKPKSSDRNEVTKSLARSLDSRRSSTTSRKSFVSANNTSAPAGLEGMLKRDASSASTRPHTADKAAAAEGDKAATMEGNEGQKAEPARMREVLQSQPGEPVGQTLSVHAPDW